MYSHINQYSNTYQTANEIVKKQNHQMSLDEFEQEIIEAAARIGPFDSTFEHCGYSEDGLYN